MEALGINIFAGGFSSGVGRHFKVVGHLEHDQYGAEVSALNLKIPVWDRRSSGGWPITDLMGRRIRFVYGNPPCAPFSQAAAGRELPWYQDPRLQRTLDMVDLLEPLNPDVMAIESVCQSWSKAAGFSQSLADRVAKLGYATTVLLHDARYLGVPQKRPRLFHVFHRVELQPFVPEPSWHSLVSVGDAWKGLRQLRRKLWSVELPPHLKALWMEAKQGEKLYQVFDRLNPEPVLNSRGQVVGRPGFLLRKLPFTEPAGVLLGGLAILHPKEPRLLYPEELHALATFPLDWQWPDGTSYADAASFCSRGVAPKVGEWLAKGVAAALAANRRINKPFTGVMDLRKPLGSYEVIEGE